VTSTADPLGCPDCHARFASGAARCPRCALPLTGPLAAQLWQVDQQLAQLGAERTRLLAALRTRETPPPRPAERADGAEARPRSVQNLLLGLGVFLLAVAAAIFVAVAWGRLGVTVKTALLLAVTAAATLAVPATRRRGLAATAEALAVLAVGLALLDAHGLRRAGLLALDRPDGRVYWAGATALVAALAAVGAARVGARAWRYAAASLGQLPVPLLAARLADIPRVGRVAAAAVLLAGQAVVVAALASGRVPRVPRRPDLRALCTLGESLAWLAGLQLAGVAAYPPAEQPVLPGMAALLALAAAAGAGAWIAGPVHPLRHLQAAAAAVAVALAAYAPAARALDSNARSVALAGVVLLLVLAAAPVPAPWRPGPVGIALATAVLALAEVAEPVLVALAGPLSWLADPWTADPAGTARGLVTTTRGWAGDLHVPVVLGAAALAAALAGALLARPRPGVAAGGALATTAVLTVALALDLGYPAALGLELVLGAALLVAGAFAARRGDGAAAAFGGALGAAVVLHALAWALATQAATLVALAVAAAAAFAAGRLAPPRIAPPAFAATALLASGEVFALARAGDAPAARAGFLLALAALAVVAVGTARRRRAEGTARRRRAEGTARRRRADGGWLEAAGAAGYAAGLAAALADPGWTSYTLAVGGLGALAVALRADRRPAAALGGVLLTGSGWVRLHLEQVDAPEAYLAPVGAVALVLGHLRRRADRTVSSWRAYAAGLGLSLLPSLLVVLAGDPGLARPLLLGLAALLVLLAGARAGLAAPLVVGAGVLAVDAAVQVAPLAAALPRWVSIGAAGLALLALGATYEQRLRDLRRVQQALSRLD
jgi:hypothetical protein